MNVFYFLFYLHLHTHTTGYTKSRMPFTSIPGRGYHIAEILRSTHKWKRRNAGCDCWFSCYAWIFLCQQRSESGKNRTNTYFHILDKQPNWIFSSLIYNHIWFWTAHILHKNDKKKSMEFFEKFRIILINVVHCNAIKYVNRSSPTHAYAIQSMYVEMIEAKKMRQVAIAETNQGSHWCCINVVMIWEGRPIHICVCRIEAAATSSKSHSFRHHSGQTVHLQRIIAFPSVQT